MRWLLALSLAALTACATQRYHYALEHVYITPWTHLAQEDIEQIIWVVSHSTLDPVVGLSQSGSDPGLVRVITNLPNAAIPNHCTGFNLRKQGGSWRIVFQGSSSETIAGLILSNPM
jgi:hypothetical protein